jgi:hypothetical protein
VTTRVLQDGGRVRIPLNTGIAARLFGIPFLAAGAYLLYQLAGGVVDLLTGRAAVSEMLVGTLILIVFTAAFLMPGWLLMFSRARVEIDRSARSVTCTRDFRVYQRDDLRPLADFRQIEVDRLSVSSNRQSRSSYQVELAAANRNNVVVGLFDDGDEALAFGRELAAVIELPVSDRRHIERDGDE